MHTETIKHFPWKSSTIVGYKLEKHYCYTCLKELHDDYKMVVNNKPSVDHYHVNSNVVPRKIYDNGCLDCLNYATKGYVFIVVVSKLETNEDILRNSPILTLRVSLNTLKDIDENIHKALLSAETPYPPVVIDERFLNSPKLKVVQAYYELYPNVEEFKLVRNHEYRKTE